MSSWIYRIQDDQGRGPFKPGFTKVWCDFKYNNTLPPIYEDFGWDVISSLDHRYYYGTAVRNLDILAKWFNRIEQKRLKKLGYKTVKFKPFKIIAESEHQILFASALPLSKLPINAET